MPATGPPAPDAPFLPDERTAAQVQQANLKAQMVALGVTHAEVAAYIGWTGTYLSIVLGRGSYRVADLDRALGTVADALRSVQVGRRTHVSVRITPFSAPAKAAA